MKKINFVITIALLLTTLFCYAQSEKESINESWKHITEDVSGAEKADFNDLSWQKVNVPHTWNATDAYTAKQYYRGIGWYRKYLFLTKK